MNTKDIPIKLKESKCELLFNLVPKARIDFVTSYMQCVPLQFEVYWCIVIPLKNRSVLKVAFSQKGLMRYSFLQTDKPNYFPELEFWFFFFILNNGSNHVKKELEEALMPFFEHSEQLHVLIWHNLSHLEFESFRMKQTPLVKIGFWKFYEVEPILGLQFLIILYLW